MREQRKIDYSYSNDEYLSVFVGTCESEELLNTYLEIDYELFEYEYIASEFDVDFGINIYDEDYFVAVMNSISSNQIAVVFKEATVFNLRKLEALYPNGLGENYNTAIVIGKMKYEGTIKEIHNDEFGHYKFLGTFSYT